MTTYDIHTSSPLLFVAVWAGLIFGLGVIAGAALGWLVRQKQDQHMEINDGR